MRFLNVTTILLCSMALGQDTSPVTPQDVQRVDITRGHTQVLKSKARIKKAEVFDSKLVKVTAESPNQIRVSAIKAGVTDLTLVDEQDAVKQYLIYVADDTRPVQEALQKLFPDTKLGVVPLTGGAIVVRGSVRDEAEARQVIEVCETFYPNVLNHLKVARSHESPQQIPPGKRVVSLALSPNLSFGELKRIESVGSSVRILDQKNGTLSPHAVVFALQRRSGAGSFPVSVSVLVSGEEAARILKAKENGELHFGPAARTREVPSEAQLQKQIQELHQDVRRLIKLLESRAAKDRPTEKPEEDGPARN